MRISPPICFYFDSYRYVCYKISLTTERIPNFQHDPLPATLFELAVHCPLLAAKFPFSSFSVSSDVSLGRVALSFQKPTGNADCICHRVPFDETPINSPKFDNRILSPAVLFI